MAYQLPNYSLSGFGLNQPPKVPQPVAPIPIPRGVNGTVQTKVQPVKPAAPQYAPSNLAIPNNPISQAPAQVSQGGTFNAAMAGYTPEQPQSNSGSGGTSFSQADMLKVIEAALAARPNAAQAPAQPKVDTTQYEQDYMKYLVPSEQENQLSGQLTQLEGDTAQGVSALEGQGRGIPLQLVRGQQAKLQEQGLLQQQTLTQKLALEQAKRTAALGASKFSLERADKLNEAAQKAETEGAYTLGEGQTRYDAKGNVIAKGSSVGTKPITEKVGDNLYQYNSATGSWDKVATAPTTGKQNIVKINGVDYMVDENGNYTTPNVPAETQKATELKTNALQSAKELLNKFNEGTGTSAVGGNILNRLGAFGDLLGKGTGRADFTIQFDNLKALLSLDNVKYLKGQGQVSDAERRLLEQASAKLNRAQSETEFKKALEDIVTSLSGIGGSQGGIDLNSPQVQILRQSIPGITDEEIKAALGFNSVGGDTKKLATAIGQFESGGNYKAVGNQTASGDRAYGKYQVMGNNIPSWTKEVLGQAMTVQQFLSNPQAQDKVAEYKLGQYLQKHGTIEDAASVWFSGRPIAMAGNSQDVNKTTVPQYVNSVRSIYNRLG